MKSRMKCCCFFLSILLHVLVATNPIAKKEKYHGVNRFWTVVKEEGNEEKTYLALHQFRSGSSRLMFLKNDNKFPKISTYVTSREGCLARNMHFTFTLEPNYYLRGEVEKDQSEPEGVIWAKMFENCPGFRPESSAGTTRFERRMELDLGHCFSGSMPFTTSYDDKRNAMDFKVDGTSDCPAFLVFDKHTTIPDDAPRTATYVTLNESYHEHEVGYWWKRDYHVDLPTGVTFDVDKNPQFDATKMVPSAPYFIRIGIGQPIPTFQFEFESCAEDKIELQLNENLQEKCIISFAVKQTVVDVTINHITRRIPSLSLSLVFDKKAVYIKTFSPDVSITRMDSCEIVDVPDAGDQMIIRATNPSKKACGRAVFSLLKADVNNGIEVLINRTKALRPDGNGGDEANGGGHNEHSTTDATAATASMGWIWIVVGVVVSVLIIGAIIAVMIILYMRRRKEKRRKKLIALQMRASKSSLHTENRQKPAKVEDAKDEKETTSKRNKKKKKKAKKHKKKDKKRAKSVGETDGDESSSKVKSEKSTKMEQQPPKEEQEKKETPPDAPPPPETPPPPQTPRSKKRQPKPFIGKVGRVSSVDEDMPISAVVQSTQTTTGTGDEKVDGRPKQPPKDLLQKPKQLLPSQPPRPLLKFRLMYDTDGFGTDKPYDYHAGETSTFDLASTLPPIKKQELKNFDNFWECIQNLATPTRKSPVYVNIKITGENVFFVVRDLVADASVHAPFRSLSARILEPVKRDFNPGQTATWTEVTTDGQKKFYLLRVFIISYHPLTMEIHCRGQCPLFMFTMFDCDDCPTIQEEIRKAEWMSSSGTCRDDWDTFVCRVKRTPMNSHQFLSYNGPSKPKNADDVNHMMIIRGDRKPSKLRPCVRGCKLGGDSFAHQTKFSLETQQQRSPTLATQKTQQQSASE